MFRAVKMNEFALRARECESEVSALLILGVWLRPRAVLDERSIFESSFALRKFGLMTCVTMYRNILHISSAFYHFLSFSLLESFCR